ncbi:MAG: methyltransferase domain-containing protein [Deltaproteobacteria bacterium]|nr:methyltransferase domain-containing protein [Deltaproteobacteria bacterium]
MSNFHVPAYFFKQQGFKIMKPCAICSNNIDNELFKVKEMMFGLKDEFQYFQCSHCQCLQIQEIPQDLSKYYPENYYSYKNKQKDSLLKTLLLHHRNRYAFYQNGFIGSYLYTKYPYPALKSLAPLHLNTHHKILDVGCGSGELLLYLRNLGFDQILGIDPFLKEDITYNNQLKIQKKNLFDLKGTWDMIMFHHSLRWSGSVGQPETSFKL